MMNIMFGAGAASGYSTGSATLFPSQHSIMFTCCDTIGAASFSWTQSRNVIGSGFDPSNFPVKKYF
jgi:hypothetical protein